MILRRRRSLLKSLGRHRTYPDGYMPAIRRTHNIQKTSVWAGYDGNGLSSEVMIKQIDDRNVRLSTALRLPNEGVNIVSINLGIRQLQRFIQRHHLSERFLK